ncbi:hypothetical protein V1478_005567 [Vespula squamosa]|uniref:Uncharacterized protein n=1 Tax=Vespula squamosa TaxID=30214 RepID=A0ABD2BAK6_VESSQ
MSSPVISPQWYPEFEVDTTIDDRYANAVKVLIFQKRQERVASTQEVMCRIWERSVERKAASELRKMTERIQLMTDGGNQMEEIECAKKKKRKRWGYQAIRKGWSQAMCLLQGN